MRENTSNVKDTHISIAIESNSFDSKHILKHVLENDSEMSNITVDVYSLTKKIKENGYKIQQYMLNKGYIKIHPLVKIDISRIKPMVYHNSAAPLSGRERVTEYEEQESYDFFVSCGILVLKTCSDYLKHKAL